MDEEKAIQEEKPAAATKDNEDGLSVKKPSLLDEAREITTEQRKVNEETRLLLDRKEVLMAEERISGRALAGFIEQKKVLTDEEYAEAVYKGDANPITEDGFK